jgi:hypothetical protein
MELHKLEWIISSLASATILGDNEIVALKEARDIIAAIHGSLCLDRDASHKSVVESIWKAQV